MRSGRPVTLLLTMLPKRAVPAIRQMPDVSPKKIFSARAENLRSFSEVNFLVFLGGFAGMMY